MAEDTPKMCDEDEAGKVGDEGAEPALHTASDIAQASRLALSDLLDLCADTGTPVYVRELSHEEDAAFYGQGRAPEHVKLRQGLLRVEEDGVRALILSASAPCSASPRKTARCPRWCKRSCR